VSHRLFWSGQKVCKKTIQYVEGHYTTQTLSTTTVVCTVDYNLLATTCACHITQGRSTTGRAVRQRVRQPVEYSWTTEQLSHFASADRALEAGQVARAMQIMCTYLCIPRGLASSTAVQHYNVSTFTMRKEDGKEFGYDDIDSLTFDPLPEATTPSGGAGASQTDAELIMNMMKGLDDKLNILMRKFDDAWNKVDEPVTEARSRKRPA
jgi:hypothetical protein